MAVSIKISQLAEGGNIQSQDVIPIARGGETYKIPASQIVTDGQNRGGNPGEIFLGKNTASSTSLRFRTLSGTEGIVVATQGETVVITASGQNPVKTKFFGNGVTTAFTIAGANSINPNNYRIDIDGVLQEPGQDYTINGSNIVFTEAPPLSGKVVVLSNNLVRAYDIIPSDGSVNNNKLVNDAVTTNNILNSAVTNEKLAFNGGSFSLRNKIINGNFDIWQRETSLTSGTGIRYLTDRFANSSIGSTYTASRQAFDLGQTAVPNNPTYFYRTVVTSVAGNLNNCVLVQRIESVKTLANKTATVSFYAKADSNKSISVSLVQWFGTGGTPSGQIDGIGSQKLNLTTSWQKFTVTANIPSIQNKTLGTNNDDFLQLNFWFDAGSSWNTITDNLGQQSGTFDIAQVQLEEGSVATPFEQRPIGLELSLCQRYYEKSYDLNTAPRTATPNGAVLQRFAYVDSVNGEYYTVNFKTEKRINTPTISIISQKDGALDRWTDTSTTGSPNIFTQVTANYTNSKSFVANIRFVSSIYTAVGGHWTADAEL